MSKSEVNCICAELDAMVGPFRERRLAYVRFPYVFIDDTPVKAHDSASAVSKAIVIAPRSHAGRRTGGPRPCAC